MPSVEHPYFLVGAERSGTTLLRLMLCHHPRIAWLQEFEYAVDRIRSDGSWPDLNDYYEWLECHRIFRATGFAIERSLSYPELVKSFLAQRLKETGKPIIGATVHRHFERLLSIWPQGRFIHLVRDARDVAQSCIGMGWAGNTYCGVERWIEAEQLWSRVKQQLPEDRFIELKYEDLISHTVPQLTRLCAFIDVSYDRRMLDYPTDTTYSQPNPKLIGQWRRRLGRNELQLVEGRVGNLLTARGYELSGVPLRSASALHRTWLHLQNRIARVRFRQRRYGFSNWLAVGLSRRLRLRPWQKRLTQRLNAIDELYLK